MTIPDPIPDHSPAGDLLGIIQDLSLYLCYQKETGNNRLNLSSKSLAILASWEQNPLSRVGFRSQGPASARVVLVDGHDTFFTGDAGRLLEKILGAMNLSPEAVSICNAPDPGQVHHHVMKVRPKAVIALGEQAAWIMTGTRAPLEKLRGQFFDFQGIAVIPTFHPAQLMDDPALKRPVWEDVQKVMKMDGIRL
ncbi:MAG: uracil-DNA glycosylase [Desulfotignum sp.]|nr:uracil-DNA glycosylase [Desulfotignum sp.]MCF8125403.1 uracil-DNA glycosylase [Desulfotignum sp.]